MWDHVALIEHMNAVLYRLNFFIRYLNSDVLMMLTRISLIINIKNICNILGFEAGGGSNMMKPSTENLCFKKLNG